MGKKKIVSQEFNTVDIKNGAPIEGSIQSDVNASVLSKIEDAGGGTLNIRDELKAKLDAYEKLEKTVSALTAENSTLKDKMAEYVEELTVLRSKPVEVKEIVKEVPVKADADKKLMTELTELREENDSYLMKISELTFENAKMTAELTELKKQVNMSISRNNQPHNKQRSNMNMNINAINGYSSWN